MLRITATKAIRPATIRAALTQTQVVARRQSSHDSHDHHAEEHHKFEEENFSSPLWKYSLGAIGVFYLIGKYDDYIEQSGRVHPMTRLYSTIMTDKVENRRIFSEYQKDVAKAAEFNIMQWEEKRILAGSMDNAVYYKRSAKWGAPVGTQIDMEAAKGRTPVKE